VIYPDFQYVDTASGGVQNRNHTQTLNSLKFSSETDCYRTYFRYPEEFKKHFDKTKSVRGYSGLAYADIFPVDIDHVDLAVAHKTARDFLIRIGLTFDVDIITLNLFFSGAKGFHIFIPAKMIGITPSQNIAMIFKKFADLLLTPWEIKYDAQIYDTTRLFRVNNTRNSKTGLFKVALTAEEVLEYDIAAIKELATNPRNGIKPEPAKFNPGLAALYKDATEKINQKPAINKVAVDSTQIVPKNTKLCYIELLKGTGEGERDATTYRLACYFKHQGLQEDMVVNLLLAWNTRNAPPLPERIIEDKVKSAFSEGARDDFGCNDSILQVHCQKGCYLLSKSTVLDISLVKNIEESAAAYEIYTDNLKKRLCIIDIPVIGPAMRGIAPGEVLVILARSGVGKTAVIMNLQMRIGLQIDSYQLFFTMEMPIAQVYERMAQCSMGITGREVENTFREKQERDYLARLQEQTRNMFKRILMVEKDFLTIEDMIALVRLAEQKVNQKIGVVVIDYMGRMKNKGKNSYEALSHNALAIKHMAKELDVAVICAAQVGREKGGDGSLPIDLDAARDSGQIEEAADFVIGMWRPDLKKNADAMEDKLIIKLLKNRRGPQYIEREMRFLKQLMRIDDYMNSFWNIPEPESRQCWYDKEDEPLPNEFALGDECPF